MNYLPTEICAGDTIRKRRSGQKGKKQPPIFGGCFLYSNAGKTLTKSVRFIILSYVKCFDGDSAKATAFRECVHGFIRAVRTHRFGLLHATPEHPAKQAEASDLR